MLEESSTPTGAPVGHRVIVKIFNVPNTVQSCCRTDPLADISANACVRANKSDTKHRVTVPKQEPVTSFPLSISAIAKVLLIHGPV